MQEEPTGRAVGGKARMANLSPEERKEIAAKAAKATLGEAVHMLNRA